MESNFDASSQGMAIRSDYSHIFGLVASEEFEKGKGNKMKIGYKSILMPAHVRVTIDDAQHKI
ncbi:MAG: hypothetical protein NTAFB01_43220 [Nitrospira sp.]